MTARSKKAPGKRVHSRSSAFRNVKDQIGYCGLWCGSCLVGNGTLNELAQKCGKAISDYGVNEWGPKEIDCNGLLKGLAAVGSMEPCVGCLKGGGRTNCEIRACARGKGIADCVECSKQRSCENSKIVQHMRSGARGVGMKVKEAAGDRSRQIERWMVEIEIV